MIHSSRLVAVGADPNYASLFDALPQVGGIGPGTSTESQAPGMSWWDTVTGAIGGIAGGPVGGVGTGQINAALLTDCLASCNERQYRGEIDQAAWQRCTDRCQTLWGSRKPGQTVEPVYTTGCDTCGTSDIPACLSCAWSYVAHAGIEIGLIALALLGLYLWLK
jgi:hypothetical protein